MVTLFFVLQMTAYNCHSDNSFVFQVTDFNCFQVYLCYMLHAVIAYLRTVYGLVYPLGTWFTFTMVAEDGYRMSPVPFAWRPRNVGNDFLLF